jgi:hypothetical protein
MPAITPKQLSASSLYKDLGRGDQKIVKKAIDILQKANIDDLNTVIPTMLKGAAAKEYKELKGDKKHPEAHIFSFDGHDIITVMHTKKDGDLVAKLYDKQGAPLLDKGINLGKWEVEPGPDGFFMEGGSDADLLLGRG